MTACEGPYRFDKLPGPFESYQEAAAALLDRVQLQLT